jgi:hypothetical protein
MICGLLKEKNPTNLSLAWWYRPVILTTWETEIRKIVVQARLGQKLRPYLKIN